MSDKGITHYVGDDCQGGHHQDSRIAELERQLAENARLQARVEEAEGGWEGERSPELQAYDDICEERDRFEALAERRKEALDEGVKRGRTAMEVKALVEGHHSSCRWYPALEKWECHPILCADARAAIEEGESEIASIGSQFPAEEEGIECEHDWIDARNEVVKSGEYCGKCRLIRLEEPR